MGGCEQMRPGADNPSKSSGHHFATDHLSLLNHLLQKPEDTRLKWADAPLWKKPYAYFLIWAVDDFESIIRVAVVKCTATVFLEKLEEYVPPRVIEPRKDFSPRDFNSSMPMGSMLCSTALRRASMILFNVEVFWFHKYLVAFGPDERREACWNVATRCSCQVDCWSKIHPSELLVLRFTVADRLGVVGISKELQTRTARTRESTPAAGTILLCQDLFMR